MSDRSPRSDLAAIKKIAITSARAHGAGAVAVTSAHHDEVTGDRMRGAFDRGDFSTWNYGDEYARRAADPSSILARARSVVCIAMPYATAAVQRDRLSGRVSNYAWSEDYHRRMKAMLNDVARAIDEAAGEPVTAIACDTKPIAERAFAERAGLGWIGKHTNLIAPSLGSFVFLGEIVTTLELPPDAPLRKSCGSCMRCVDICPTGALRGDYTIDANRCIADLTQRAGSIPREMRALLGDWIWGCDLCQDVCPPTQRAGTNGDPSMTPLDGTVAAPKLTELLQLRAGEFKRRYARTAMGWRGAAVLRRNAAVGLGNALDRSTVGGLAGALRREPNSMVRAHVAWALGRIGSPQAISVLRLHRLREADLCVRQEIDVTFVTLGLREPLGIL